MQEPALTRAPRHVVRVNGGPCTTKVVLLCSSLLYMLAIRLAICDMAMCYSQRLTLLLFLLLYGCTAPKVIVRSQMLINYLLP
jgi:hypothetical protein